jgi:hypothetical protein
MRDTQVSLCILDRLYPRTFTAVEQFLIMLVSFLFGKKACPRIRPSCVCAFPVVPTATSLLERAKAWDVVTVLGRRRMSVVLG